MEGNPQENREVTFHDDDPRALEIVLLAVHLRFKDVPQEISYLELLEICRLCDKYCMIEVTIPWLEKWRKPLTPLSTQNGCEGWLFVAWTLGDKKTMQEMARKVVLESRTDEHGHCSINDHQLNEDYMPPGMLGE